MEERSRPRSNPHFPRLDSSTTTYAVKLQQVEIGMHEYTIRSLLDRQQYHDPHGHAHARGISPASWAHFGQLWPSSMVLAEHMDAFVLDGQRVLEVGCGLAVPGLVLHRRGADISVSDRHPECEPFLRENLQLNHLAPLRFHDVDWSGSNPGLGTFDIFIASDILYERNHPRGLVEFFDRHAGPRVEVLIVDPRRGQAGEIARRMRERGFSHPAVTTPPIAGFRLIHYRRGW